MPSLRTDSEREPPVVVSPPMSTRADNFGRQFVAKLGLDIKIIQSQQQKKHIRYLKHLHKNTDREKFTPAQRSSKRQRHYVRLLKRLRVQQ